MLQLFLVVVIVVAVAVVVVVVVFVVFVVAQTHNLSATPLQLWFSLSMTRSHTYLF